MCISKTDPGCMRATESSPVGLPSSPMDRQLSSSCPKYWGMKRRTLINQLASKLIQLASLSPVKQHRSSQKCITHIKIFQRCRINPNFVHLMERRLMYIQQKNDSLAQAFQGGDHFPFSNDSCRRTSWGYRASWC